MATVTAVANFDPETDANVLRKAFKGFGTDEPAVTEILCKRTAEQRLAIAKQFKTMFGKDLVKDLKSELSGNMEDLCVMLIMSSTDRDVFNLFKAMKGIGTDEACLIDILCTRTNAEIEAIKEEYKKEHGKSLEDAVISETSGHFQRLCVSLLQANRCEDQAVDQAKAEKEAKELHEAGEKKIGTDESKFNQVFASRSFPQLLATFEAYGKLSGYDLERSVERETSGSLKEGYTAVIKTVKDSNSYYAERLHETMKGAGTDDTNLIRLIISHCERDMEGIKKSFFLQFKKSLAKMIEGDCSGDYKKSLLTLIGEN